MKINLTFYRSLLASFIFGLLALTSCKKEDIQIIELALTISASSADVSIGEEVTFEVAADGKNITDAIIYVDDKVIDGFTYKFDKNGKYKVYAKKDDNKSETLEIDVYKAEYDVYVAGSENNGTKTMAKYWKNGEAITLGSDTAHSYLTSIHVAGNDVYASGYIRGTKTSAAYWKNTTGTVLSSNNASASAIYALENQVYVAGHESNGSTNTGKYWINNQATNLSDGTALEVRGMHVVDEDNIYIAGNEFSLTTFRTLAQYWYNGELHVLTDGMLNAEANGIFADGADVYVAGYEKKSASDFQNVAKYWKNDVAKPLTTGEFTANAFSVFVDKDDVYVAGEENNGTVNVAKYWKNGKEKALTDGTKHASATSITVIDGDVYVCGTETVNSKPIAMYWINDDVYPLTNGSQNATATSIYVVKRKVY